MPSTFFNLIEGAWGEQLDLETPPKDEDEPAFKRFKTSFPTPSTASTSSTMSSSTPRPPPIKHFIPPWEVGALAGIPASQRPSYELQDGETKSITAKSVEMLLGIMTAHLLICITLILISCWLVITVIFVLLVLPH